MNNKCNLGSAIYVFGRLCGYAGQEFEGSGLYPMPGWLFYKPKVDNPASYQIAQSLSSGEISDIDFHRMEAQWQHADTRDRIDLDTHNNWLFRSDLSIQVGVIPNHLIPLIWLNEGQSVGMFKERLTQYAVNQSLERYTLQRLPFDVITQDIAKDKGKRKFLPPELEKNVNAPFYNGLTDPKRVGGYQRFYDRLYSGECQNEVQYVEIPQTWTINLSFSSADFEGAKVTLSNIPNTLHVMGYEGEKGQGSEGVAEAKTVLKSKPWSVVRAVTYQAKDEMGSIVTKQHYAATFWIVGGFVENDDDIKRLCRFDVDLNYIQDYWVQQGSNNAVAFDRKNKINPLNIPNNHYSLSEQVLHLPIRSPAGRATWISGDPITVEEALLNHAPNTFQHVINQGKHLAGNDERAKQNTAEKETTALDAVSAMNTWKGAMKAATNVVLSDSSTDVLAKMVAASLIPASSTSNAGQAKALIEMAAGVYGAGQSYLDFLDKLPQPTQNAQSIQMLKQITETLNAPRKDYIDPILNKADDWVVSKIPDGLKQYWPAVESADAFPRLKQGAKVINWALDKPLGYLNLATSAYQAYSQSGKNDHAFSQYMAQASQYGKRTQSVLRRLTQEQDSQQIRDLLDQERQAKEQFTSTLINSFKEKQGHVLLNGKPFADKQLSEVGKPNILTILFRFDSAQYDLPDSEQAYLDTVREFLMNTETDMSLHIVGHTCRIGSEAYN
ncbi:hypothetical protein N9R79_12070, partial [Vibrio sp.]|nr:hypothetical protein [Vibrio sp.]